ncbi:Uncharacterised protein [Mycobacteroides abscessus subsp. abscessus]|nr:Uncharacterised protein [Mycobacteroides abscessus subsp. abscessus]
MYTTGAAGFAARKSARTWNQSVSRRTSIRSSAAMFCSHAVYPSTGRPS